MKNKILWIITIFPIIFTVAALQFMPDQVPLHYNMSGTIDRWGSKYENLLFPIMIIMFTVCWKYLIRYFNKKAVSGETDKIRKESENNAKVLYYTAVGMAAMFGALNMFILYLAYEGTKQSASVSAADISSVTGIMMGIFIIVIGNIMPKAKRNSMVGLRTVWSMESDKTWADSNRFGGMMFVLAGIFIIVSAMLLEGFIVTAIMLSIIIIASAVSIIYSYKVYRREKSQLR